MFTIDLRPDMGTFATIKEALYYTAWLTRITGQRYRVIKVGA